MKLNKNKILQHTEKIVSESKFFLIELNYRGDNRNTIVEVIIDNAPGITADDCKEVSKKLDSIIEEEQLILGKYRLEVSSPGVDRPLKYLGQYSKHLNRKFELQFVNGEEMNRVNAKLVGIKNDELEFVENKNHIKINFENIKSAKVMVSFK